MPDGLERIWFYIKEKDSAVTGVTWEGRGVIYILQLFKEQS